EGPAVEDVDDRQAHPVDRDRIAVLGVGGDQRSAHGEACRVGEVLLRDDLTEFLDYAGEHVPLLSSRSATGSDSVVPVRDECQLSRHGTSVNRMSEPTVSTRSRRNRSASEIVPTPASSTAASPAPSTTGARYAWMRSTQPAAR